MIRAHVTDRGAMAARSPSELAMYLRAQEWVMRGRDGSSVQWLKTIDGEEFEALQPQDSALRDYATRVHDLLSVLAVSEDRSELDVLNDITNVSMDVHSVRAFPADTMPGMIGLDDGVQAFESSLDTFTEVVPQGVTANLCEALVGLGGESGHPFELSLRLAPSRPFNSRRLAPIRFRRDHLPVLASAAQELRERDVTGSQD